MSWRKKNELDNLNLSQDRICRALGWEHFILVAHASSCVYIHFIICIHKKVCMKCFGGFAKAVLAAAAGEILEAQLNRHFQCRVSVATSRVG